MQVLQICAVFEPRGKRVEKCVRGACVVLELGELRGLCDRGACVVQGIDFLYVGDMQRGSRGRSPLKQYCMGLPHRNMGGMVLAPAC